MEMLSPHLPHDTRSLRLGILLRSSHSLPFSAFANRHLIGSLASCAAQVGNAKESGITTPSLKSADAGFPPMLNGSTSGEYMGGSKKIPYQNTGTSPKSRVLDGLWRIGGHTQDLTLTMHYATFLWRLDASGLMRGVSTRELSDM